MSEIVLRQRIRQARKALGLTQQQLAEQLDRSVQTIYAWERGLRYPRRSELQRLSESLGKPLAWFFTESDGGNSECSYLGPKPLGGQEGVISDGGDGVRIWDAPNLDERLTQIEALLRQQSEMLQQLLLEFRAASGAD